MGSSPACGPPGVEGDPELRAERRSATVIACSLRAVYAANQASKVEESKFRSSIATRFARLASVLAVADSAKSTRDSVFQLAAA